MKRVALVTGANKGIGLATVRGLCKQFDGDVYLTARDEERGLAAVQELQKEGLDPKFHELDILDYSSIMSLKEFLTKEYGGLDVLVNNAAIMYKKDDKTPLGAQADITIRTNFSAILDICDAFFPLLRTGARVVHVTGMWSKKTLALCSEEIKSEAINPKSISDVARLLHMFVKCSRDGSCESKGFPQDAYGMSKIGLNSITALQQKMFDEDKAREDIIINACHPGLVITDLSGNKGQLTPDQGAENLVCLCLLPPKCASPRGNVISQREIIPWGPSCA